ncbi:hypothetical protein ARMGADRAFT_529088 [Armillaria gallica]|uniref:Uncharacterized protein n=1 Tax=Armillaria gallica TaxID=47427 RepID=A0A2H3CYD1_ARMGA|nr:hypothetical protein ARMGADRAFT_529088 [Armillaria gallica]
MVTLEFGSVCYWRCMFEKPLLCWNLISGTSVIVVLLTSLFFVVVFVHVPFD